MLVASVPASLTAPFDYFLLPLDVASATYGQPVSLGPLAGPDITWPTALLATPDGRTLYISVFEAIDADHADSRVYAIDAVTYAPKGSWTWGLENDQNALDTVGPFSAVVAASADGSLLLMGGWYGLAIVDVADDFATRCLLHIKKQVGLDSLMPVVSQDNSRAYLFCCPDTDNGSGGTDSDSSAPALACGLIVVDIDLTAGTLSLVKNIPIELTALESLSTVGALSADAGTLYVSALADMLTSYDTSTFAAVQHQCGASGNFTPLQIVAGPEPNVFYCVWNSGGPAGTVSIVTLA